MDQKKVMKIQINPDDQTSQIVFEDYIEGESSYMNKLEILNNPNLANSFEQSNILDMEYPNTLNTMKFQKQQQYPHNQNKFTKSKSQYQLNKINNQNQQQKIQESKEREKQNEKNQKYYMNKISKPIGNQVVEYLQNNNKLDNVKQKIYDSSNGKIIEKIVPQKKCCNSCLKRDQKIQDLKTGQYQFRNLKECEYKYELLEQKLYDKDLQIKNLRVDLLKVQSDNQILNNDLLQIKKQGKQKQQIMHTCNDQYYKQENEIEYHLLKQQNLLNNQNNQEQQQEIQYYENQIDQLKQQLELQQSDGEFYQQKVQKSRNEMDKLRKHNLCLISKMEELDLKINDEWLSKFNKFLIDLLLHMKQISENITENLKLQQNMLIVTDEGGNQKLNNNKLNEKIKEKNSIDKNWLLKNEEMIKRLNDEIENNAYRIQLENPVKTQDYQESVKQNLELLEGRIDDINRDLLREQQINNKLRLNQQQQEQKSKMQHQNKINNQQNTQNQQSNRNYYNQQQNQELINQQILILQEENQKLKKKINDVNCEIMNLRKEDNINKEKLKQISELIQIYPDIFRFFEGEEQQQDDEIDYLNMGKIQQSLDYANQMIQMLEENEFFQRVEGALMNLANLVISHESRVENLSDQDRKLIQILFTKQYLDTIKKIAKRNIDSLQKCIYCQQNNQINSQFIQTNHNREIKLVDPKIELQQLFQQIKKQENDLESLNYDNFEKQKFIQELKNENYLIIEQNQEIKNLLNEKQIIQNSLEREKQDIQQQNSRFNTSNYKLENEDLEDLRAVLLMQANIVEDYFQYQKNQEEGLLYIEKVVYK